MMYVIKTKRFECLHTNKSYDSCPNDPHKHAVSLEMSFHTENEDKSLDFSEENDFVDSILSETKEFPDYWTLEILAKEAFQAIKSEFHTLKRLIVWIDDIPDLKVELS